MIRDPVDQCGCHPGTEGRSSRRAELISRIWYDALPPVAVERLKHLFIDYIGIAMHASTLDSSQPVRRLAAARPVPGGATFLGRPDPVSAHWAAFANGMAAHSMELDDTYL